jgi:hypothetical protein
MAGELSREEAKAMLNGKDPFEAQGVIPAMNYESSTKPQEQTSGQLNPTWVEWLMGYPIGWTDLNN